MLRTTSYARLLARNRGFCSESGDLKIVASVLFERLLVVVPKIDPVLYAFQEFSFRCRQQYLREYPEACLKKSDARGKGDYQIDYPQLHGSPRLKKIMIKGHCKEHLIRGSIFFFMVPPMVLDGIPSGIFLKKFMSLSRH